MRRELGIARCGLACCLCSENAHCDGCQSDSCVDKDWCENRKCSISRGIPGCYACDAECGKGLLAKSKPYGFSLFARRFGMETLLDCLERNEQKGIVYHREGITGDYDGFDSVNSLLEFIRSGKPAVLETERLILRELTPEDYPALYEILSDPETMRYYPKPFDAQKVHRWIQWNQENYETYGFGLWAVILKETGEFLGDCGITMQNIHGQMLPEIGYHIHKDHQRKGYASEAAARCMEYAFMEKRLPMVYSYMKDTNVGSYSVALKNGMHLVEKYADPVNTVTRVYAMERTEWEERKGNPAWFFRGCADEVYGKTTACPF